MRASFEGIQFLIYPVSMIPDRLDYPYINDSLQLMHSLRTVSKYRNMISVQFYQENSVFRGEGDYILTIN